MKKPHTWTFTVVCDPRSGTVLRTSIVRNGHHVVESTSTPLPSPNAAFVALAARCHELAESFNTFLGALISGRN